LVFATDPPSDVGSRPVRLYVFGCDHDDELVRGR
jgi:hypothetical protein